MDSELLEHIVGRIASALGTKTDLGGTVLLDFGIFGSVFLNHTPSGDQVRDGAGLCADCAIKVDLATFTRIAAGQLDGATAYRRGKLEVCGDDDLARQILPTLERALQRGVTPQHPTRWR